MLNIITASAVLFGASALATSYTYTSVDSYGKVHYTTSICTAETKPTPPPGYAPHSVPVYHKTSSVYVAPVKPYTTKPAYVAPVKPYTTKPAYVAPVKPYTTSCTEAAAYTTPVYVAPVYSAPAPVYSAPVYHNSSAPVYYAPAPVYSTAVVTLSTTTYCPSSTPVYYHTPVYSAPVVPVTTPCPSSTPVYYTHSAPAPVYTAPVAPVYYNSTPVPVPSAYTGAASSTKVSSVIVAIAAVAGFFIIA